MRTIFEFPAENPKITDLLARLAGICSLSVVPVFLLRSPRAGAPFFVQHLTCSVIHPFVDCTPLKTPVGADLEGRNFTVASQSIDRRPTNVKILGYFGNRHEASGRCIVAGLHCASMSAWRSFMAATSIMPLADVVRARRAPVK